MKLNKGFWLGWFVGLVFANYALADYSSTILADSPSGYWRMGDTTGAGIFNDATANNRDWTTVNFSGISATSLLTGDADLAQIFDGSNDYGSLADDNAWSPSVQGAFSVEAWVKWGGSDDNNINGVITKISGGDTFEWALWMRNDNASNNFQFTWLQSGGSTHCSTGTGTINSGTIYHVVGTMVHATRCKLYLNGTQVSSSTTITGSMTNTGAPVVMATYTANGNFLDITVDEVAFYPTELAADRVTAHYNAGLGIFGGARRRLIFSKRNEHKLSFFDWFLTPRAYAAEATLQRLGE